jgi:AraC family transcriptional regulator
LIYKAGFTVTGLALDGDRLTESREGLWERLGERFREIPQADPDVGYGVVWTRPDDGMGYLAGLAAGPGTVTPPGMVSHHFNKQLYAVFHHSGPLTALQETVRQIFDVELFQTEYRVSGDYYFEVYDDRFDPGEAGSIVFLWVPVRAGMKDSE